KASHGRVVLREAHRLRMRVEIAKAQRELIVLKHPEKTKPMGKRADPGPFLVADSGGDELLDLPIRAEDPKRRVFRVRDCASLFNDALQDHWRLKLGRQRHTCDVRACTWARRCSSASANARRRAACSSSRR